MSADTSRLAQLAELGDYVIAEGDPDPRGWAVIARDGRRIGRIHDLIVDPGARKARYADVLLDEDTVLDHKHHVLVPLDVLHIGEREHQEREIRVSAAVDELRSLPDYRGLPLSPDQEQRYRSAISPGERRT